MYTLGTSAVGADHVIKTSVSVCASTETRQLNLKWLQVFVQVLTCCVSCFLRRTTTASGRCPTPWPTSSSSASPWSTRPVSRMCERSGCRSCRSTRPACPTCSSAPRWACTAYHAAPALPSWCACFHWLQSVTQGFSSILIFLSGEKNTWTYFRNIIGNAVAVFFLNP